MRELEFLADTAGVEVVGRVSQRLDRPTHHYLGSGKLEELKDLVITSESDTVVFDDELTPTQQRNLENALRAKVIDRTALILDIFSRQASTREGQLQVELAQHQYLLPRLVGQWSHLERLGGGIGTRGPGETQLETDRRLIRRRIQRLELELQNVSKRRESYMSRRKQARLPVVSMVGYTNAGKSSLFNAVSGGGVKVQDRLFSTLDPVTRRIYFPGGRQALLTDTVGFIHKLPPTVVDAFRATLEELREADLLLHIIDVAQPKAPEQAEVVEQTLKELDLDHKPRVLVVNKMDLLTDSPNGARPPEIPGVASTGPVVLVSALKAWNLDGLLEEIECQLLAQGALPPAEWQSTPSTPHSG